MQLIASSRSVLEAGVPANLADSISAVAGKLLALPSRSPGGGRVLVLVGASPYAEAVLRAAGHLATRGWSVDVLGGPVPAGARPLDHEPPAAGYRLIVEGLGASALSDAQAALFEGARWYAHVLSVGTPAGIDADTAVDAGTRAVELDDPGVPDENYRFVRVPLHVRADVTVAPRAMVSAHALHTGCGQVVVASGNDGAGAVRDLLGQYARYNAGADPLERELDAAAFLPDDVDPRASVAIADGGASGRLRAEGALREGAGAVYCDADVPGTLGYGPARVHVSGDEITGRFGRALVVDGLGRDDALRTAWEERAVVVVPGEQALVVQPVLHADPDADSGIPGVPPGIWTVHDAGIPWVSTPGGRDILIGMMASTLARVEVSYGRFLANRPRVDAGDGPMGSSPDDAVGLYAVAAGLAAGGAPTTARDIAAAIPDAWRECTRRLRGRGLHAEGDLPPQHRRRTRGAFQRQIGMTAV